MLPLPLLLLLLLLAGAAECQSPGLTEPNKAVSKIEIIANTTDLSQLTITKMNLPGVGSITGQMFGQPYRGVGSLTWTYTISNSLNGANYVAYASNTQNKVDLTTQVKTVLTSGDEVTLTLNIYGFDNTGTPTAVITDTVTLAES